MKDPARKLGPWVIERTLGRDFCGQYHAARRRDGQRATLYLLSGAPSMARIEPLRSLVERHRELSAPGVVRFTGLDQDGSDLYLIAEQMDDSLASVRSGRRPAAGQIRPFGAVLAAALSDIHDHGLVHGGLELDNVMWAPGGAPQILGTGVAALGMTDGASLARGDVAALGRILCALLLGVEPADAGRVDLDGAGDGGRHTLDVIRLLADPSITLSMREAHAMLANGVLPRRAHESHGAAHAGPSNPGAWSSDHAETLSDGGQLPAADHGGNRDETVADTSSRLAAWAQAHGYLARYRILTRLGRGGMGEVFLAEDPVLRRGVAIKRIRPGFEQDRLFRARLRREAQLAARLHHRAIVAVFDLVLGDDADHLVMEYVPGPSLHALSGGGRLPVAEVARIAAEITAGLACAHDQGIIHRDLKLENVLIGPDRQPKITDFGVARCMQASRDGSTEESLTRGGFILGTLRAMSPEQLQNHDVDARADLFSLGVMLYELVTGTSPFAADSDAQTILHVLHHRQRPAHELAPEAPRALSELIDQLLDKTPSRRPGAHAALDRLCSLDLHAEPRVERFPRRRPITGPIARGSSSDPAVPAGERRQVTVVCIELIASRGDGSDATDPEILAGVLPAFRAHVDDILAAGDGLLINALGHRFVACFGHPRPLEDAARRAVLAGRAMLDAAAGLRSPDPVHAGAQFTASGAIHTGVAVDRGSAGDELVLGTTLDTALRLLQLGAGQLWLSAAAARLVDTEFRLEQASSLPEGVTSALRLVRVLPSSMEGSGEHDRPLVAREHEMQLLLAAWQNARQGRGQVALLIGEPGIGKSRLVRELIAAVATDRPRQIVLRGSAHRQRSALDPVAEALGALPLGDTDLTRNTTTDRIRALTGRDEAEQVLHFLGRLAAPPEVAPERARHQLLAGLRDVLLGGGHDEPTLLVVEDLHWLDPSTIDLIAQIIATAASWPLFLVMTTRPGVQPPWPAAAPITQLRLGRLDASAIEALITHASNRALPDEERAVIAARADGVPLFAEELVRAALELGDSREVPSTLRDALTARLHQLGPDAVSVAHIAAVAGREFTAGLIATAGGLDRGTVDRELDRLVAAEILSRRHGRIREPRYQFGHVLLQQAAYDELLAADRRHLHGQLADALLAGEHAGTDPEPGPELIAHHLAGARRFDEAVASAHRAARRALGRHARIEARELLRQALSWLDQLPAGDARDRTEIALRMELCAVLITTEGYTSAELEQSCHRTEILCERHDDMPLPVKYNLWSVRLMRGASGDTAPLLGWFQRTLERSSSAVERMMAHFSIGIHDHVRASHESARQHFQHAMVLFDPADHARVVQTYGGCGGFYSHVITTVVLWKLGRFADAWYHARATVALAERLDPYCLGCALTFDMMLHIAIGDTARVEACADRVHEIAARYDFPYLACWALCGRGWVQARRGDAERAMTDLDRGAQGIRQIGVRVWFPYCLSLVAESAIALGRFDRAEHALDEALALCRGNVDRSHEPELLRLRGKLILGRDAAAHAEARAAFSEALAVAERHGGRALALRAATDLAALLRDDHFPDMALAVLGPVYRGFAPEIDDPNLAPARRLFAELLPATA